MTYVVTCVVKDIIQMVSAEPLRAGASVTDLVKGARGSPLSSPVLMEDFFFVCLLTAKDYFVPPFSICKTVIILPSYNNMVITLLRSSEVSWGIKFIILEDSGDEREPHKHLDSLSTILVLLSVWASFSAESNSVSAHYYKSCQCLVSLNPISFVINL